MTNLVRWVAIIETATVIVAGAWLYGSLMIVRQDRYVRAFGLIAGYIIGLVGIAIFINVLSPFPPTPGVRVYAWAISPAVVALIVLAWLSRNRTSH